MEKGQHYYRKKKKRETASSPEQDFHPDWDCICGTTLYPLSCGELAINGKQRKI